MATFLLPWINGHRTRLPYQHQQAIATWAIKPVALSGLSYDFELGRGGGI